jgi:AI-2 transport protein TqsA
MDTARVSGTALSLIASGVVIGGLYWFADLLTPLALAVFLWLTIDAFAEWMRKRMPFLPRKAAVPIALTIVFVFLAFVVAFVIDYAASFAGSITDYRVRIDALVVQVWGLLPLTGEPPTVVELLQNVNLSQLLRGISSSLQAFGGEALFVIIYVACLFAAQAALPRKIFEIFPEKVSRVAAIKVTRAIASSMEQYLYVQTVTGLMIAAASWVVFMLVGLENALFWALVIFLLSYVPVIGAIAGSILPTVFALVQFSTPVPAVVILATTQIIGFVVGNIIQPRMTGDTLNLSILMVFLSLAFWGKLWGGPGTFLAVPLTVMAMIILSQFESTRWIAVMMSNNGNPDGRSRRRPEAPVRQVASKAPRA